MDWDSPISPIIYLSRSSVLSSSLSQPALILMFLFSLSCIIYYSLFFACFSFSPPQCNLFSFFPHKPWYYKVKFTAEFIHVIALLSCTMLTLAVSFLPHHSQPAVQPRWVCFRRAFVCCAPLQFPKPPPTLALSHSLHLSWSRFSWWRTSTHPK